MAITSLWSNLEKRNHVQMMPEEREHLENLARDYLSNLIRGREINFNEESELNKKLMAYLQNTLKLNYETAHEICQSVLVDIKGYGVINDLIVDPYVSDIYIHKHDDITYEKNGRPHVYDKHFRDEQHLMMFIEKLAMLSHARIDVANPLQSFTLPEGYRTTVSIPPVALHPNVHIRRFVSIPSVDDLIANGYFSKGAGEFFKAAIKSKRNILFIGGMGTGKTTMIAISSKLFDKNEHPLLIEEVMECPMNVPHLRRLVARPPSIEGTGAIPLGLLLKQGLMMKPTRVIVSEVRDGAIFYMLQAMLVGHEGSMSTIHANSAKEALFKRIPAMLSMSTEAVNLSHEEKIAYAASALHLIIHLEQDPKTGVRYCRSISEVVEEPEPNVVDVFVRDGDTMKATGHFPKRCQEGAYRYNVEYDPEWFKP